MATATASAFKKYSSEQVSSHKSKDDCWLIINGKVYDVTKFLEEHPGGEEVMIENSGRDASESFEDVGHSTDAREMMKDYLIGEVEDVKPKKVEPKKPLEKADIKPPTQGNQLFAWLVPAAFAVAAALAYRIFVHNAKVATGVEL